MYFLLIPLSNALSWALSMQLDGSFPHKFRRPMLLSLAHGMYFDFILIPFQRPLCTECSDSVLACVSLVSRRIRLIFSTSPPSALHAYVLFSILLNRVKHSYYYYYSLWIAWKRQRNVLFFSLTSFDFNIFLLFSVHHRDCHCMFKLTHSKTHETSVFSIAAIAKLKCSVIR